jgi:hypothetical protein
MEWHVLKLQIYAAVPRYREWSILNMQSETADKGWFSKLYFGRIANKSPQSRKTRHVTKCHKGLGFVGIFWNDLGSKNGHDVSHIKRRKTLEVLENE